MGTDDDIIRNGTFRQWRNYTVVFFGHKEPGYTEIEGGLRVKGGHLATAALAVVAIAALIVGALVF